jgi:hypothetical protein
VSSQTPGDIQTQHFLIHFEGPIEDGTGLFPFASWLETAYSQISSLLGLSLDSTVTGDKAPFQVNIQPSSSCPGGAGGSAASGGVLNFCMGNWNVNQWTLDITAHEMCNLITGECVTGGWPREWWANDHSPFPALVSMTVLRNTGYGAYADAQEVALLQDPTYVMWKSFVNQVGWGPIRVMFQVFRKNSVNLANIAEPLKSAYVIAGLVLGGGTDLTNQVISATGSQVTDSLVLEATSALSPSGTSPPPSSNLGLIALVIVVLLLWGASKS